MEAKEAGRYKNMLGMMMIAMGTLAFVPQLSGLASRLGQTTEAIGAELFSALPSIGLGVLHAGQALAFEPGTFFAGALRLLLSFWPLLLVAAGTLLLRTGSKQPLRTEEGRS